MDKSADESRQRLSCECADKCSAYEQLISELKESEARFNSIFYNHHVTMLIIDPRTGDIINANEAACIFYGYEVTILRQMNITDINVLPDDTVRTEMKKAEDETTQHFFFRHRLSTGDIRDVEVFSGPIQFKGRKYLYSIVHDITEQNETQSKLLKKTHELTERVKELNCLFGLSQIAENEGLSINSILKHTINLIPAAWQYPDITCARVRIENRAFTTVDFKETQWEQSAVIQSDSVEIGDISVFYVEERPPADEGPFLKEERRLLDAISLRLGKIIERVKTETALLTSESQYRKLAEQVNHGIGLSQNGCIQFVNHSFSQILGYNDPAELIGKRFVQFISADCIPSFEDIIAAVEKKPLAPLVYQCRWITKTGRDIWVEARLSAIEWKGDAAVLCTIRDVTDIHEREIAFRKESEYLRNENIRLRSAIKERYRFGSLIGKSPPMHRVYELIIQAAGVDAGVIIYGESGTGKELAAQAIHDCSNRRSREFVTVNCGAIPETILEREFFGHKKGAFTGADTDIHGYLDLADGGTLFLDEVGELSPNMQVKLLRAIDRKCYFPVGSNQSKSSDFRIIAATNKDLKQQVKRNMMRQDFFYRIHVIPIHMPPLRERKEDIPLLVEHISECFHVKNYPTISGAILESLYNYHWPGNIRELQNVLYRYYTMGKLGLADPLSTETVSPAKTVGEEDLRTAMAVFEKNYILEMLNRNRWRRDKTAVKLGLPLRTLYRKMKKYGL